MKGAEARLSAALKKTGKKEAMTHHSWIVPCLFAFGGFVTGFVMPGSSVEETKIQTIVEPGECLCGMTRTCPFGPGIVGRQECRTNAVMANEWARCEPAPKETE